MRLAATKNELVDLMSTAYAMLISQQFWQKVPYARRHVSVRVRACVRAC